MVGGPNVGRESAALHAAARPEASNVSEASRASEIENKAQREVSSIFAGGARGGESSASPRRRARILTTERSLASGRAVTATKT